MTEDKEIQKSYGTLAKKIKQRITQLKAATHLEDIKQLSFLRLHQYQGNKKDIWSIDIQKNWRILFKIAHTPIPMKPDGSISLTEITIIEITSIEDPH